MNTTLRVLLFVPWLCLIGVLIFLRLFGVTPDQLFGNGHHD